MTESRREVGTRKINFFHRLAAALVRLGLTPNQVSVASAIFGILGGLCFYFAAGYVHAVWLLLGAIVCIQLRLICNLIDGLMAVECGLKTAFGEVYNDLPDRVSDIAFIVGAGFFAAASDHSWMIYVAWFAATFAVLTAYVRVLGATLTGKHDFCGPMAKQHRMFALTIGALASIAEIGLAISIHAMGIVLAIILFGSIVTCIRRLVRLFRSKVKET